MKREKTIRSNFDYLDSEVNVTKFLKLISKDQTRKDVGEKIELLKSFKGHEAEHQAAYLLRLGESMIKVRNDIEEKIGTIKKFWPILPSPKIKFTNWLS